MSDLAPDEIEQINRSGWSCDNYPGICKVEGHINQVHQLIYDPNHPSPKLTLEFEGNAIALHIGELAGDFEIQGDMVVFPPRKFVFLLTKEAVNLPFDIDGTLFQKPTISNLGLLFYTLGHVDPGFHGRLTCTFLNTTRDPVRLKKSEDVLYLVLSRTEKPHYPRFGKDFHREPQIKMEEARRNQNLYPAFVFTKSSFVTRNELYAWLGVLVATMMTILAISTSLLLALKK